MGEDDSCERQPQGILVDPSIPCEIDDRKEDRKRRGVERAIGKHNKERCVGCDDGCHEDAEKDKHRQLIGQGIGEGTRSEKGEPQIHSRGVSAGKKEKPKDEEEDERRGREEVALEETDGEDSRRSKQGHFHKETCARDDQESHQGQEDDPAQVNLTRGPLAWKVRMTHSTHPVWIVLNVPIKTGSVNVGRRASAPTGHEESQVVALFETDATLHV